VKNLLRIAGRGAPARRQAVQRALPTQRLPVWPTPDRTSRLVFIAKNLSAERELEIRTGSTRRLGETKARGAH
jgi:hypothetical protein